MFALQCSSWGNLLLGADGTTREVSSVETNGHPLLRYMRPGEGMLIIVLV